MIYRPPTIAVHGGRPPRTPGAPVNTPLSLTSTYHAAPEGQSAAYSYARDTQENFAAFEEVLGELEGGRALSFASGMGAVSAALSLIPHGGSIVIAPVGYSGAISLVARDAETGALDRRVVDMTDLDAVKRAAAGATMVYIETPANPTMDITDISAVVDIAHAAGAIVAADSTFSTPLITRPLLHGVDVVIHSVTKWIAGHSDMLMGAIVVNDDELYKKLHLQRVYGGAVAGEFESWLALRGLRTLPLRLRESCDNAYEIALRLEQHPKVERVRYPGLASHPGHEIAKKQMAMFGAVLALELKGGLPVATKFPELVNLWTHGTSVGGVESLIERRRRHGFESETTPQELLRLSVGIEDVEDLWSDLEQALEQI